MMSSSATTSSSHSFSSTKPMDCCSDFVAEDPKQMGRDARARREKHKSCPKGFRVAVAKAVWSNALPHNSIGIWDNETCKWIKRVSPEEKLVSNDSTSAKADKYCYQRPVSCNCVFHEDFSKFALRKQRSAALKSNASEIINSGVPPPCPYHDQHSGIAPLFNRKLIVNRVPTADGKRVRKTLKWHRSQRSREKERLRQSASANRIRGNWVWMHGALASRVYRRFYVDAEVAAVTGKLF